MGDLASTTRRLVINPVEGPSYASQLPTRAYGLLHANRGSLFFSSTVTDATMLWPMNSGDALGRHPFLRVRPARPRSKSTANEEPLAVRLLSRHFQFARAATRKILIIGLPLDFHSRQPSVTGSGKLTPDKSVIRLLTSRPVFSTANLASSLL